MRDRPRATVQLMQILDRTVRYQVVGNGDPLVLIHGLSGSTRWWRPALPALAGAYKVYLVDLPGFGSARGERFVLNDAPPWVAAWMEAIHVSRAHVIGHSMGGYIALVLAAGRPDLVRRLVLVDAAAIPSGRPMSQYLVPLLRGARWVSPGFLPVLLTDAMRSGPVTLWRAGRQIIKADIRPQLEAIQAPTLIVWGAHDTLVPIEVGEALQRGIPGSQLVVVPRSGHVPMFEQPDEFCRVVLRFLSAERRQDWTQH